MGGNGGLRGRCLMTPRSTYLGGSLRSPCAHEHRVRQDAGIDDTWAPTACVVSTLVADAKERFAHVDRGGGRLAAHGCDTDGPDHVDAHRTLALVISAYNQGGGVDSTHYDTSAMVATAEDLLGLPPMSIVDQRASRMWPLFDSRPDPAPYEVRQPEVIPFGKPDAPRNPPTAPMARQSASWDFTTKDATPEIGLNQAIWKSIRGRRSKMPAPRHEHIIGSQPNDEDKENSAR